MELSPAKSSGIVSDSEGEEEGMMDPLDMLEREPNAARFSGPRDWHSTYNGATIATNPSSHISQFSTPLIGQQLPTMATDSSSIQTPTDFGWPATTDRPRPRPRMRPVPPPDDLGTSSIGAFSTIPAMVGTAGTTASFDNSAVDGVPAARPPSLPPSSLPQVDSSSSIPAPTFPSPAREKVRPKPKPMYEATPATSSSAVPATMDQPAPSAPKRPRPKMRPPPPPEPEVLPATTNATTSSSATTTSSSNANPSTSATTASSIHDSTRRSALDDAEEYTGRGARRLAQEAKSAPIPTPNSDVDVGGPEDTGRPPTPVYTDDVINLIDSDDDYRGGKTTSKPKAKSKPKDKKKDASKTGSAPAQSDLPNERASSSANPSKRKSPQPQSSDDELGRWGPIPGSSTSTAAKPKKRKKTGVLGSDDEGATRPAPAHVPNTIDPPLDPPGPDVTHIPSSPLSSPGRSPPKRKGPPDSAAVLSPTKKPRKNASNVLVGVVIESPAGDENGGKKTKTKRKKTTKAAVTDDTVPSTSDPAPGDGAYVPPALGSVVDTSSSGLHSESSKTKTTPPTSSGASLAQPPVDLEKAQEPAAAPMDVDPPAKKQPKKRATKAKKGEDPAPTDGQETPAPKKGSKAKSKAKMKEAEAANDARSTPDVAGASSSNPDAGAIATSSNPSADAAPPSSNSSNQTPAPHQTPAPKATRPKPRHSTTPAPLPVAMGASGSLLRSTGGKSADRPLSETIRLAMGGSSTPSPRMGLSRRGSSKIAPLLAFRGVPPPPPPPMPKKPVRKKKGDSDNEDSEEGPEWEGLTEKQKEKKRREKEMAGWYSD